MEDRVERWERRAEVPLLLLALAFLVAYAWPVLDPRLDGGLADGLAVLSWSVWAAFLLDFVVRVALARRRRRYVVRHWYDVALVALPMLRPLRLLRLVALARLLDRSARANLTGRVGIYVGAVVVSSVGLGALAVLDAEQDAAGANIGDIGDALWWAVSTVTTVGYGDVYPVTTAGRFVGVALMVLGVAAVGIATALLAAWLITYLTAEEAEADLEAAEAAEVAEWPGLTLAVSARAPHATGRRGCEPTSRRPAPSASRAARCRSEPRP